MDNAPFPMHVDCVSDDRGRPGASLQRAASVAEERSLQGPPRLVFETEVRLPEARVFFVVVDREDVGALE